MDNSADPSETPQPSIVILLKLFNTHPNAFGRLFWAWHNVPDIYTRNRLICPVVIALENEDDTVWRALCRPQSTLQGVILDMVLQDVFCGVSKDEFHASNFSAYTNYVSVICTLLSRYLTILLVTLGQDSESLPVKQHVQEALRRLSPLWNTLWELVGSFSLPAGRERPFMGAIRTETLMLGFKFVILHASIYGPSRAHELDPFLLRHLMGAYCFFPSPIPHERVILLFHQVFDSQQTSCTWRAKLLEALFESEVVAQEFLDVSCQTFHGSNLSPNISDHDLLEEVPVKQLIDLCHIALKDGPEVFRTVASSPETSQKLISSMVLSCQRARCFGDPYREYENMLLTCLQTTSILAKLARRAILDVRTCYLLLIPSLLSLRKWMVESPKDLETVMDCLLRYVAPAARVDLSTLPTRVRKDVLCSRDLLYKTANTTAISLSMISGQFQAPANRTRYSVLCILRELDLVTTPAPSPQGRRHRCHFTGCECSGNKPPHHMRVCKGCWTALYCSQLCQRLDWDDGGHKAACLAMREVDVR